MKILKQSATLSLAMVSFAMLVYFMMGDQVAERRVPLIILSAIGLIWFSRQKTVAIIVFLIPLGPILDAAFLTPGRGIYATEALLLVGSFIWLAEQFRHPHPWPRPTTPVLFLALYAMVALLALLAGDYSQFSVLRMMRQLFLVVMTAIMVQDLFSRSGAFESLLKKWTFATLLSLSLLALGGIVEFLMTHSEPGSFYRGSVSLAVHIAFFSPIALSICLSTWSPNWRIAGATAWTLSIICLPLTASRGAMGSVFVSSLALLLVATIRGRQLGWRPLLLVFVIALAGIALLANPEIAGENFAYKVQASLKGDFFSTRTSQWKNGIDALKISPLVGQGPQASSNSIPLEMAQRHGIPAALLLLISIFIAMISPIRHAWSLDFSSNPIIWGVTFGILGFLLVGLAETGLGARTTPFLVMVVVISSLWKSKKEFIQ